MVRVVADFHALVAQLDRASDSDSEGRWFESSQARQRRVAAYKSRTSLCGVRFILAVVS